MCSLGMRKTEGTSLSLLSTGIAVFALPLSVLSLLVATSRSYHLSEVSHFLIPLLTITFSMVVLGGYLVIKGIFQVRRYDNLIKNLKRKHATFAKLIQ